MKKITFLFLISLILGTVLYAQQEKKDFTSYWEGKLNVSGVSLRLVLKTFNNEDGSLGAFLDSPDQTAENIPVSKIEITVDSIKFEVASVLGKYYGKIKTDSLVCDGTWQQGPLSLPLCLKKVEKLTEPPKRPQTPKGPFPYNEEEVTFPNKTANIELAGTLTYPKGDGKFPAVVMVTGSGAQDRDETIFKHKPFFVIADYLTKNGIAVLRFDDRGFGKSKGNFVSATSIDFTTDAVSAVEFLSLRKEIDKNKIGIIGHSEGGLIAPIAASSSNDIAFIVLLAGPGMKGSDLLVLQTELILNAEGTPKEKLAEVVKQNKTAYEIVVNSSDSITAFKELEKLFEARVSLLPEEEKSKPEYSKAAFETTARTLLSPWFRFFLKFDPKPYLENLQIPVLALNGEKDLQVPPKENLGLIEEALKSAGNKNYKIVELPELNHLFQTSDTGAPREYGEIEETFSPKVLQIIGAWIKEITK